MADIGRIVFHFIHNLLLTQIVSNFDSQKYVTLKELAKRINFYTPTGYGRVVIREDEKKEFTPLVDKKTTPFTASFYQKPFISFEEIL